MQPLPHPHLPGPSSPAQSLGPEPLAAARDADLLQTGQLARGGPCRGPEGAEPYAGHMATPVRAPGPVNRTPIRKFFSKQKRFLRTASVKERQNTALRKTESKNTSHSEQPAPLREEVRGPPPAPPQPRPSPAQAPPQSPQAPPQPPPRSAALHLLQVQLAGPGGWGRPPSPAPSLSPGPRCSHPRPRQWPSPWDPRPGLVRRRSGPRMAGPRGHTGRTRPSSLGRPPPPRLRNRRQKLLKFQSLQQKRHRLQGTPRSRAAWCPTGPGGSRVHVNLPGPLATTHPPCLGAIPSESPAHPTPASGRRSH